jgi:hypothetical protein
MFDPIEFDPALAGAWPLMALAGGASVVAVPVETKAISGAIETKAVVEARAVEALQTLLNEMTTEMRRQFEVFRDIRIGAEALLSGGDEAAAKIAKADIKAATDALSLIVRTIEKIDSLQRSLADDRERSAEQGFDQAAYDDMLADIERRIERRAEERAAVLLERRLAELAGRVGPPDGTGGIATDAPDAADGGHGEVGA